ncbi:uncharacterized protein LOC126898283 [Daktulosphaira vitifoliae]|uniref:uncharacterized protein LOC126898283 n=1 Tax=Daktulosphaira vitifoliae TaxID=58002 RepID=UPI0021AA9E35|nr:uncharacterized protein LOC126898283 [Daktulosphaira vitifoliae]
MDEEMKSKVEIARNSDRIMVVKLIFEEKVLNVISAYAPEVGCDEINKEVFWREMDEVMQGVSGNEDAMIGGDMNGNEGNERRGYERVHIRKSTVANNKLNMYEMNNSTSQPKKRIQDVKTGWNSTYYMLVRFVELKDSIHGILELLNRAPENLKKPTETSISQEIIEVQRYLEDAVLQRKNDTLKWWCEHIPIPKVTVKKDIMLS